MKIVCMDCQTESYAEVELLKDRKHFECDHCTESLPASSTSYEEEPLPLPSNGNIELYTGSSDELSFQSDISKLEEDDVLDISALASTVDASEPLEIDEVISLAPSESTTEFSDESPDAADVHSTPQLLDDVLPVPSQQIPSQFVPVAEVPLREAESFTQHPLSEESFSDAPVRSKGLKLVPVATPVLLGVAIAFVLFVVLGNMVAPKGKIGSEAVTSAQTVSLPGSEIKQAVVNESKQVAVAAPAESPEMLKPVPTATPQATENKAPEIAPAANQPSVAAKGEFTVQVGSHNDMEQANAQAAKLNAAGFEPRIVSVDIPKRGRWYRVQTGSFSSRDDANRYGSQIVAKGAAENFVIAAP